MQEPQDLDLRNSAVPPVPPPPRRAGPTLWVAALVIAAVAAAVAYWYVQRGNEPPLPVPTGTPDPSASAAPPASLGAATDPVDVPPLDMSDDVVRTLVAQLSSHPRVAAWLTTDGLIRNFAVVVENIANGQSPAVHLQALRPTAPFSRSERGESLVIDPRSYDRYAGIADAAASIDPMGAARLYTTLKPRIEEAYRDLGRDEPFDRALERAIVSLLMVPDVEGDVELEPQGAVYQFADPRLEQLTSAQKQLLRMGPRHVRTIQQTLRDIALALGIPPERLP